MKLAKTPIQELFRKLESQGLLDIDIRYRVADAKGTLDYKGPKIPREMWREILSFFKWTYDTYRSEAQVRLFVSPKNGTWKAWAFPQEGNNGLSIKEVNNDDFSKQRAALFEKDEEWIAWGTVHHHCDISAFQSGTDESDEEGQGGLHITVGDLTKPKYSIHCRFYHQKDLWEPDMSIFWDIGDAINEVPKWARSYLPTADRIARDEMCEPSSVEFPEQWKKNYLVKLPEPKNTSKSLVQDDFHHYHGNGNGLHSQKFPPSESAFKSRREKAMETLDDLSRMLSGQQIDPEELEDALAAMTGEGSLEATIVQACIMNDCDPDDVLEIVEEARIIRENDDEAREEALEREERERLGHQS